MQQLGPGTCAGPEPRIAALPLPDEGSWDSPALRTASATSLAASCSRMRPLSRADQARCYADDPELSRVRVRSRMRET